MNATASPLPVSDYPWSRRCSTESVYSIQGRETDVVRDTSDSEALASEAEDCTSKAGSSDEEVEYEPASETDDDRPPVVCGDSSGQSDNEIISTKVVAVTVRDDGDLSFADAEQTDSDGCDSEIDVDDYWQCAQCRSANNNPLYRYCEKCFRVRKNFFPPRPKRKRKRMPSRTESIPRTLSQLSQDSGVGSQEYCQDSPVSMPESQDCQTDSQASSEVVSQFCQSDNILSSSQDDVGSQEFSQSSTVTEIRSSKTNIENEHEFSYNIPKSSTSKVIDPQDYENYPGSSTDVIYQNSQSITTTVVQKLNRNGDHSSTFSANSYSLRSQVLSSNLKRRGESADGNGKRLKTDSGSDSDSNITDVAPLTKSVSDPAVTVDDSVKLTKKRVVSSLKEKLDDENMCIICFSEPKSGAFVHGAVAHICCCYKCAVKVWSKAKRCPICNSKVSNVLKAIVM